MMGELPHTEQLSPQEVVVPFDLEKQVAAPEFSSVYGIDEEKFQDLFNKRVQLFSEEAEGPDGEKFKENTKNGMLEFLKKKHEFESAKEKQEALQNEEREIKQKIIQEEEEYNSVRSDLGLPPDKTKNTVQLAALSSEVEDIIVQATENEKHLVAAKEEVVDPNKLFSWTNDELAEFRNSGLFDEEQNAALDFEMSLRAEHKKAITPVHIKLEVKEKKESLTPKEFSSPNWIDNFSGFSENKNLTEVEAREVFEVMKERFEEMKKDETVDRSEEIKNYENSIRNSDLEKSILTW